MKTKDISLHGVIMRYDNCKKIIPYQLISDLIDVKLFKTIEKSIETIEDTKDYTLFL